MIVLHMLSVPSFKQAEIKFNYYKYCTKTLFVIYANFEFIYKPSRR